MGRGLSARDLRCVAKAQRLRAERQQRKAAQKAAGVVQPVKKASHKRPSDRWTNEWDDWDDEQ